LSRAFITALPFWGGWLVPSKAVALDKQIVEGLANAKSLIWRERCLDVLTYAYRAAQREDHLGDLTEEEVAEQVIGSIVFVFIAAYGHGRNVSDEHAAMEIVTLCRASPDKPLADLRTLDMGE
jgi:hypothetical protein